MSKLYNILTTKMTFSERLKAIEDEGYLWTVGCRGVIAYNPKDYRSGTGKHTASIKFGVSEKAIKTAVGNSPEQAICKALKKVLLHFNPNAKFH